MMKLHSTIVSMLCHQWYFVRSVVCGDGVMWLTVGVGDRHVISGLEVSNEFYYYV